MSKQQNDSINEVLANTSDDETSPEIHPLTDKIGQLAALLHTQSASNSSPQLSLVTPTGPMPGILPYLFNKLTGHSILSGGTPVTATNQAPDQSGMPSAMQISPVSTDVQGNPLYSLDDVENFRKQAGNAYMMGQKMSVANAPLTTVDQIKNASGGRLSDADASQMLNAFGGKVPAKILGQNLTGQRLDSMDALAGARQAMVTQASLRTLMQYGGPGAAQKAASDAGQRLVNLQRAQALLDQIQSGGGQADQRQRTELATALGRSLNPTGVLTNEALNMYLPESAKGKFGNILEYWTNERQPVNFSGFIPALQDLLVRESDVNNQVFNQARQMGIGALNQLPGINRQTVNRVINTPAPGMSSSNSSGIPNGSQTQGGKPGPGDRFNQLMSSGHLSKKQAYAIMHQEGY